MNCTDDAQPVVVTSPGPPAGSDAAVRISGELISQKLQGQERLVHDVLRDSASADIIASTRSQLDDPTTVQLIRQVESLKPLSVHFELPCLLAAAQRPSEPLRIDGIALLLRGFNDGDRARQTSLKAVQDVEQRGGQRTPIDAGGDWCRL